MAIELQLKEIKVFKAYLKFYSQFKYTLKEGIHKDYFRKTKSRKYNMNFKITANWRNNLMQKIQK